MGILRIVCLLVFSLLLSLGNASAAGWTAGPGLTPSDDLSGWMDWQAGTVKPYVSVVLLETMTYEGGAHPLNYVKGITLNATGKVVTLADLKTAMPSLSVEALRDAAARECTARHISTEEAEKITEFPKEFYIGNNGHLYFIFQQYDIAPYSEGWIMADMGLFPF